jgi:hypothetical protein
MAEYTQRHGHALSQFLGEIPAWIDPQLAADKSTKPVLTIVK